MLAIAHPMEENSKRIWCDVWDHVIENSHCLLEMGKIAEKNKSCKKCIYYENIMLLKKLKTRGPGKLKRDDMGPFYTVRTLAEYMGKSEAHISYLARRSKIPFQKTGRNYLFPKDEIEDWIADQEQKTLRKPIKRHLNKNKELKNRSGTHG